jgi:hypothetical protein
MERIGMVGMLLAGFLGGIMFVYSCGGGGSSASADSAELLARVAALEAKLAYVEVEEGPLDGLAGPRVIISGANLQVRNGMARSNSVNGLGNLVIGCNDAVDYPSYAGSRYGSHNLVIGPEHRYTSAGGLVAGYGSLVNGANASVSGGYRNTASGPQSSVSGGNNNYSTSMGSNISGGHANYAIGMASHVCGGYGNLASGSRSSIGGGDSNTAVGFFSNVSGGQYNIARGMYSVVSGGYANSASGSFASVGGGYNNLADMTCSAVSGSRDQNTSANYQHLP